MKESGGARSSGTLHVLVVDDDPDMRDVMQFMLERLGFEVALAASVDEAVQITSKQRPDLIISDIGLPGQSGLALLKALGVQRQIPAIALSGYGMEEDLASSQRAGFAEHLVKPVTPEVLKAAIHRVIAAAS